MTTIIIIAIVLGLLFFFGPLSIITYLFFKFVTLCLKLALICYKLTSKGLSKLFGGKKRKQTTVILEDKLEPVSQAQKEA